MNEQSFYMNFYFWPLTTYHLSKLWIKKICRINCVPKLNQSKEIRHILMSLITKENGEFGSSLMTEMRIWELLVSTRWSGYVSWELTFLTKSQKVSRKKIKINWWPILNRNDRLKWTMKCKFYTFNTNVANICKFRRKCTILLA